MNSIVTIVVAIVGSGMLNTLLNRFFTKQDKKNEDSSGIIQSLRLLMKDRIRFLCSHYIQQKWIYEDELEDLVAMHNCYHNKLGGNGYLDDLMNRVKLLEIRGIGVK